MKKLIYLIVILYSKIAFCQKNNIINYHIETIRAKELFVNNKMRKCSFAFKKSIKEYNYFTIGDLIIYAKANLHLGNNKKAIKIICTAFENGLNIYEFKKYFGDSMYYGFFRKNEFEKLLSKYESLNKKYYSRLNYKMLLEIRRMESVDNYSRSLESNNFCKPEFNYIVVRQTDSINELDLTKFIEEYGFPNFKDIGIYGIQSIFLIAMHTTSYKDKGYLFQYFDSLFYEQLKIGNFYPTQYASFRDRYKVMVLGKQQIYGAFFERGYYSNNIENIELVDIERRNIGLPPIFIEAKIYKINKLPINYKHDFNNLIK